MERDLVKMPKPKKTKPIKTTAGEALMCANNGQTAGQHSLSTSRPTSQTGMMKGILQHYRIDNEKGYEPGNIRLVKRVINSRNRRSNIKIEYKGANMSSPSLENDMSRTCPAAHSIGTSETESLHRTDHGGIPVKNPYLTS